MRELRALEGYWAVRVSGNWRIVFRFEGRNVRKWGMHLTPEAPRSSIRALEDHSRTLGEFQERFAFRFQIQPLPSPRGAQ